MLCLRCCLELEPIEKLVELHYCPRCGECLAAPTDADFFVAGDGRVGFKQTRLIDSEGRVVNDSGLKFFTLLSDRKCDATFYDGQQVKDAQFRSGRWAPYFEPS